MYSRRQLYEKMVEFWSDHFNISVWKGDCWFLKVIDDREVIRRHALGDFRELLWGSAHSPAMLVYLDNQVNGSRAPNGARPIQEYLSQMGQPSFGWPTPDGPPDRSNYWISNLMPRWRFALALAQNQIEGTSLDTEALAAAAGEAEAFDRLSDLLLGVTLDSSTRDGLLRAISGADEQMQLQLSIAGLLASPGFQWQDQLFGPGDLAATTDYRDVLTEVCRFRLNNPAISEIFPDYQPQRSGFVRKG